MRNYLLTLLVALATAGNAFAQQANGIDMATGLRSSGKIWVVIIGLLVIFCLFIFYLFTLDRRIGRIEKKAGQKH